jgi:hypothetical protein
MEVDLGLHVGPADHAPGIVNACIGKADPMGPVFLVFGGIDRLAAKVLLPWFSLRAVGADGQQVSLPFELGGVIEVLGLSGGRERRGRYEQKAERNTKHR